MCLPGKPAQYCAGMRLIAWLTKHIAIKHNNSVGSDNNTIGRVGASGIGLTPCQQGRVRRKRHWAGRQRSNERWWRRGIALFTIVGHGVERLTKQAQQLTT